MQRRVGESILLGEDVEIRILDLGRNRVRIGITAPQDVAIRARSVEIVRDQNRAAALLPADPSALLTRLLERRENPENRVGFVR
jgi:carbon storage regulator